MFLLCDSIYKFYSGRFPASSQCYNIGIYHFAAASISRVDAKQSHNPPESDRIFATNTLPLLLFTSCRKQVILRRIYSPTASVTILGSITLLQLLCTPWLVLWCRSEILRQGIHSKIEYITAGNMLK